MLHPVGPEPVRVYWLRRLVILGVGLSLLVAAIAMIINAGGASAVSADPPPSAPPLPTAAAVTNAAVSPTPAALESSSALSASPRRSSAASPGELERAGTSTAPSKSTKVALPECERSQLRVTLAGDRTLKLKQPATFALAVINGSAEGCAVSVSAKNFELKIYSGSDRIWSTKDCATSVTPITATLGIQQVIEWDMTWDGRRSATDCEHDSESLEAGTYVATAELTGSHPVRLRMLLTD